MHFFFLVIVILGCSLFKIGIYKLWKHSHGCCHFDWVCDVMNMSGLCSFCVPHISSQCFYTVHWFKKQQHGFAPRSLDWNKKKKKKRYCFAVLFKDCVMMTIMLNIISDPVFFLVCVCVCVCARAHVHVCVCFCVHLHLSLCVFQMLMAYETFELGLHEERKQPVSLHNVMFDEENMKDSTTLHWFFRWSHK